MARPIPNTTYVGLKPEAEYFLKENKAIIATTYTGYLDDEGEIAFCIYKTYDGNAFAEVFQQEIWEYGPNIFTCLIDLRKPTELLFKWTKEEMER